MKKAIILMMIAVISVSFAVAACNTEETTTQEAEKVISYIANLEQSRKSLKILVENKVNSFALRLKKDDFESQKVEGEITTKDTRKSLEILNRTLEDIIQESKREREEILESSPGLNYLTEMEKRYCTDEDEDDEDTEEDEDEESEDGDDVITSPF